MLLSYCDFDCEGDPDSNSSDFEFFLDSINISWFDSDSKSGTHNNSDSDRVSNASSLSKDFVNYGCLIIVNLFI